MIRHQMSGPKRWNANCTFVGSMKRKNQICTLNLSDWAPTVPVRVAPAVCPTQKRLADAFACLEKLERQRAHGQGPVFGKFVEERIIWRELLDLELQAVDEQIERISAAAGDG